MRFPERWLNDRRLLRLSDQDHRTFVMSLLWTVANRTDGLIETEDLPLIPTARPDSAQALLAAGLWTKHRQGWSVTDWSATQTSREELEVSAENRRKGRVKKANQRAAKVADSVGEDPGRPGGQTGGTTPATPLATSPGDTPGRQDRQDRQDASRPAPNEDGATSASPPHTGSGFDCSFCSDTGRPDGCQECGRTLATGWSA